MTREQSPQPQLTLLQEASLSAICERYYVEYRPEHYHYAAGGIDSLPDGYYAGWVGGREIQKTHPTIYVGVSPEGRISS